MSTFSEIDVSNHSHRKWKKDDLLRLITTLEREREVADDRFMVKVQEISELKEQIRELEEDLKYLDTAHNRLRARLRNERNAFKNVEDAVSRVRAEYFRNSPEEAAAAREAVRNRSKILRHGENYKQGDLL